ncbi:hypothetical protein D3C81_2199280 [compost metagenome]
MENVVIEDGSIINTDLAFEYSTINVTTTTMIDSVKNPISGIIKANGIGELILDDEEVVTSNTLYELNDQMNIT